MRIDVLFEALKEREELIARLDAEISRRFQKAEQFSRLRRGAVQSQIFTDLDLVRTPFLCKLFNERMVAKGFSLIINRGDQYYGAITRQASTECE